MGNDVKMSPDFFPKRLHETYQIDFADAQASYNLLASMDLSRWVYLVSVL